MLKVIMKILDVFRTGKEEAGEAPEALEAQAALEAQETAAAAPEVLQAPAVEALEAQGKTRFKLLPPRPKSGRSAIHSFAEWLDRMGLHGLAERWNRCGTAGTPLQGKWAGAEASVQAQTGPAWRSFSACAGRRSASGTGIRHRVHGQGRSHQDRLPYGRVHG